jgi:acetyl esterase/lipase
MQPGLFLKLCLPLLLTTMSAGCFVHLDEQPRAPTETRHYPIDRIVRNIVYTGKGWPEALQADLYLPRRRGRLPVVLTVHGGGWANRSRDDMTNISEQLAQRGYAVLNLDYRFAPRYPYPAQLLDLQQALRWITANAARYDFDPARISAWGYSSGAHLAALLGGLDDEHLPEDATPGLPRLRAVVAGGIPADLRSYDDSPIVKRFLGGSLDEMPGRYAEASPVCHVSVDDAAVFLYHGKLDTLVRPDQSREYYDALTAAGVDAQLYLYGWRGHITMFLFGGDAEARAIDFLDQHNGTDPLLAVETN